MFWAIRPLPRFLLAAALVSGPPAVAAAAPAAAAPESQDIPHLCIPITACWPKGAATLQVKGEGAVANRQLEVLAWSWGSSPPPSVARTTSDPQEGGEIVREPGTVEYPNRTATAKPSVSEIPVVKLQDKSSAKLMESQPQPRPGRSADSVTLVVPAGTCTAGTHYPSLTLESAGESYDLSNATVTSCEPALARKGKGKGAVKVEYMTVKMETVLISG